MWRPAGLIAAAMFFLVPFPLAKSIDPQQQPPQGGYRLKVSVNSVILSVSVHDKATSLPIANLRKEDFLIYEDGKLQTIDQLIPSEAPFSPLLLIDNSGSTRTYLPVIKSAAIHFVRQLKAGDRIAVGTFNSLTELVQDFTADHDLAVRAISSINPIGGTALYDAIMNCIDLYLPRAGDRGERSALVVFTDGVDNQLEGQNTEGSRTIFSELFRRVQQIDPVIYAIFLDPAPPAQSPRARGMPRPGIGWPRPGPGGNLPPKPKRATTREIYDKAREQLRAIADQTGGRMYALTKAEDLTRVYQEIAQDLLVQYLIAYTPNNHGLDGMWHDIRVWVKESPDAIIRARKGYYAPKAE